MLDLELFVSTDAYENRISQLEGYITSLNMCLDEYNDLNNQIDTLITGEDDSEILPILRERAASQIDAIKVQISYALECKAQLQKTLDTMKENSDLAKNIVSDAADTAKNVVGAASDAAKVAATAAEVAALL